MSIRAKYPDHLSCSFEAVNSKWVSDHIVKDRRICLYGIRVHIESTKSGLARLAPEIPAMIPLMKLIQANPKFSEFRWDGQKRKWMIVEYDD